jgi:hypothetical protein
MSCNCNSGNPNFNFIEFIPKNSRLEVWQMSGYYLVVAHKHLAERTIGCQWNKKIIYNKTIDRNIRVT